jgi:predicted SAM-dependent methyltransferase
MKLILKKVPLVYKIIISARSFIRSIKGQYVLSNSVRNKSSVRIVIGSSGYFDDGWLPTDIEYLNILNNAHWERYFQTNHIDAILAEHVWEHLTLDEGFIAARFCYQYLKPGGYLRIAVPDGYHPSKNYIDQVKVGGTGEGADDHKVLFNYLTLTNFLEKAGFEVDLLEYFDLDGKFHFKDWDPNNGKILRSRRFDDRNKNGSLKYSSLIIDAIKNI